MIVKDTANCLIQSKELIDCLLVTVVHVKLGVPGHHMSHLHAPTPEPTTFFFALAFGFPPPSTPLLLLTSMSIMMITNKTNVKKPSLLSLHPLDLS